MSDTPKRIQMHRRKGGWRKDHPDAVIVARPTKWGNPYAVGKHGDAARCVERYQSALTGLIENNTSDSPPFADVLNAQLAVRDHIAELRGRDLACWCPLDAPCHADVLLRIANSPVTS